MAKKSSTSSNKKDDIKKTNTTERKEKKVTKKVSSSKKDLKGSKKSTASSSTNKKKKTSSSSTKGISSSRKKSISTTNKRKTNIREDIIVDSKKDSISKKTQKKDKNLRDSIVIADSNKSNDLSKKIKSVSKKVREEIISIDDGKTKLKTDKTDSKKSIRDSIEILSRNKKEDNNEVLLSSKNDYIKEESFDKITNELEEDITNGKYIEKAKILIQKEKNEKNKIKRKRKGKNKYVIDLEATKEYKNLERDLRSLYDKTNDIIDDIDTKDISKNVTVIEDLVVSDTNVTDKKGLLDYISQKVLNIVILFLSIIFCILLIGVIVFIIYVSTV